METVIALLPSILDGVIVTACSRPHEAEEDALAVASVAMDSWWDDHRQILAMLSEDQQGHLDSFAFKVAEAVIKFIPAERPIEEIDYPLEHVDFVPDDAEPKSQVPDTECPGGDCECED